MVGLTRVRTIAEDHDFNPKCRITPNGIFLPEYNELSLFFVSSKLTADCIMDLLEDWWKENKNRFPQIRRLVINQDNGPENNSHRTQFMKRMVDFSDNYQLDVNLAYYPPYHSKYNPVRRVISKISKK